MFRNDEERERATAMGIDDFGRVYALEDMARGNVIFAASGVTDGSMLSGVHRHDGGASTETVVMRSSSGTVRWIKTRHDFDRKAGKDGG